MKIGGQLKLTDNVQICLFDQNGMLIDSRSIHNTVTSAGKNDLMDQILASPTAAKMGWMAIGTGTPAATLLGAEVARVPFTSLTRSNNIVTAIATFGAGIGTGAITESGTFNIVTANTIDMWMSASFGVINKAALDTLTITWTLTAS